MTGGFIATGPCAVCGRLFGFNPSRVPSYEGLPICRDCIILVNEERRARGLPEWEIYPDSYGIEQD